MSAVPALSVVIPTYNRAPLAVRAAECALAQVRPGDEVIVVDDGSRDDTGARLAPLTDRIRYIRQANGGASSARNTGVLAAEAAWIAFLDSDDLWADGHLDRCRAALAATGGRAWTYFADTDLTANEGGGRLFARSGVDPAGPFEIRDSGTEWALLPLQPMMLQSSVIRRDAYLRVGGLDPAIVLRHDTHLFLKLCIGRPACAVAGVGAVMSEDDTGGRLSEDVDAHDIRYWQDTVLTYGDTLSWARSLTPGQRHELERRLAAGHLGVARTRAGERAFGHAALGMGRAVAASPRFVAARAASKARRAIRR